MVENLPLKECGHHEGHVCLCALMPLPTSEEATGETRWERDRTASFRCDRCGGEWWYRHKIEAQAARLRHRCATPQEEE